MVTEFNLSVDEWVEPLCLNFRIADWKKVRETLSHRLTGLEEGEMDNTPGEFFIRLGELTHMISEMIEECVLNAGTLPYQKHWWSPALSARCMELQRVMQRVYIRRSEPEDPVHLEQKAARRAYGMMIENAKREHWEGFLASLDEWSVWMAHRYVSGCPTDSG